MQLICTVYRCPRREGTYLLVERGSGLERVPEALLAQFGTPREAMTLVLTPERRLARARGQDVIDAIGEHGYYLQLPPPADPAMAALAATNNRLERT